MNSSGGKRIRKAAQTAGILFFAAAIFMPFSAAAAQRDTGASLDSLRQTAKDADDLLAVAYLGFGTDFASYMAGSDTYGRYLKEYPFLADIPRERWLNAGGYELYALVPADSSCTVSVCSYIVDETNDYHGAAGDLLWQIGEGDPFLLLCNVSEIMPNVIVLVEDENGEIILEYSPGLSMKDGSLWTNRKRICDFTIYGESAAYGSEPVTGGYGDGGGYVRDPGTEGTAGSLAVAGAPGTDGSGREVYSDLIDRYTEAMNAVLSEYDFDLLTELGSDNYEPMYGGESVGYLYRDLDGNGQEELIFIRQYERTEDSYVQDLYTFAGGEVRHLISGFVRNRFLLCSGGGLFQRASSGASDSFAAVWKMNDAGDELVRSEVVQFKNADLLGNMTDEMHYYYLNMADGVKREITEDDACSRVQDFEARVQMPQADELQIIVTKAQ